MNSSLSLYENLRGCIAAPAPADVNKLYNLYESLTLGASVATKREDRDVLQRAKITVDAMIHGQVDTVWQKIIRVYPPRAM